ncbi:unnamed protein product [Aphanomyces euteiches]|uniref:Uncharacterized protein n=1 Tax=Aphanomyces euteiches TaxID=100861 RepID=A0A6G0WLQ8_9STRA|nr:hypothetical protein Ae201684_013875 [Aphanomyces euteiches]KAH9156525.1 hypothetical protein AeRB84_001557 [Aphanomyces euteiches]
MHGQNEDDLKEPLVEEGQTVRMPMEKPVPTKSINVPYAQSAGPNPYAVPQYDPSDSFSGNWPEAPTAATRSNLSPLGARLDVWVSGLYTVVAGLTVIQGFGIMLHMSLSSVILGAYLMAFGAGLVLYDLKSVVFGLQVDIWFPFLGNYLGRGFALLFLFALNAQNFQFFQLPAWIQFIEGIGAMMHFAIFMTTQPQ